MQPEQRGIFEDAPPMPTQEELVRDLPPEWKSVTMIFDSATGLPIPEPWTQLLELQKGGKRLLWRQVWGSIARQLPGIIELLEHKCIGVCVCLLPDPALVYIFGVRDRRWASQKYNVMIGRRPLSFPGVTVSHRSEQFLETVPASFRKFYDLVHDGWCDYDSLAGPRPVNEWSVLTDLMSEKDVFGPDGPYPLDMHTLLSIAKLASGDRLCVDMKSAKSKAPKGIRFYHGNASESEAEPFCDMFSEQIRFCDDYWGDVTH